ncbi:hypothetical protein GQX74_001742 [Glossina fuscipes]|nr:hypothetical protein GQX74_001742 [Glossina fuscipes]
MEVPKGDYEFHLLIADRKSRVTKKQSRRLKSLAQLSEPLQVVKVFPPKPARVFLYIQPQNIKYERAKSISVSISLEHEINTLTKLTDFYKEDNEIHMDTFWEEKPTFTLTIKQDDLADIEKFTESPMKLILYENVLSDPNEVDFADTKEKVPVKKATAYGHVDLIEFFEKKRSHTSVETFLYPLDVSWASDSCKITWKIYTLMPIMREVRLSNVIFIGLTSLFNIEDSILDNCDDLVAKLSFQSRDLNERGTYEKIFICKYTVFTKQIISEQNTFYKWEKLKDPEIENYASLGIYSGIKFSIGNLFTNLLRTENVDFNFEGIDIDQDYALVCNSTHRFILTDKWHIDLEKHLACDKYEIIVEIYKESDPEAILLQGFIDLSIFMYPGVINCSFAVELKPPMRASLTMSRYSKSWGNQKSVYSENYLDGIVKKTTFTVISVCTKLPITEPAEDLNETYNNYKVQCDIFKDCWKREVKKKTVSLSEERTCEEKYKSFDDQILRLIRHMAENNTLSRPDNNNKSFFCTQITNIVNRILPLIACDFNVRYPTKTNAEFVDLMTIVFRELTKRCSGLVQEALKDLLFRDTIAGNDMQSLLIREMDFAKLLYHMGNKEMSQYLFDMLDKKYNRYALYRFYVFLYNVEMENFELARQYLNRPWQERYEDGGISVTNLCEIYLDYMEDINSVDGENNAAENLLNALTHYCEEVQPKIPIGWMILYCIYKKHDYRPGMSYARWKYENVMENLFFKIEYIPKSRWQIFNNFQPKLGTERQTYFWKACEALLQLGLYHFAWLLFEEIADELEEVERYILNTSFKLAVNLIKSKFITRSFSSAAKSSDELKAFMCLVNGNIEYYRQPNGSAAMSHYGAILDIKNARRDSRFQLGILRYAYRMLEEKEFDEALEAFQFASTSDADELIANIGKAKALYFLNHLEEAELYFAEATRFTIYLPNTWAYLALINLRLGENYKALLCWEYAHLDYTNQAFRVFLYLKPTKIIYRREPHGSVDITLEHQFSPISKLTDFHKADNVIRLDTFSEERPTFSLPIKQDDIDQLMRFSDSPLKLTLYENKLPERDSSYTRGNGSTELDVKSLTRVAVAQGYLDLLPYFSLGRAQASLNIFLYPLSSSWDSGNCQIMWDVYSLMPLIKEVKLSNIIFISFGSLFNVANSLLDICDDLVATLSWRSKDPKKVMYKNLFICKYTAFSKKTINKQNVFYKWQNLKDPTLKNCDSLGIYSDVNFSIYNIFSDLLCTENAEFDFADIDMRADFALVCNSIHRFVLTDKTHVAFESILSSDQYEISVEIFKQSAPHVILLQGSIDLSVFMYPKVTSCSFAIELKRPTISKSFTSRSKISRQSQKSYKTLNTERSTDEISKKNAFAIIDICLKLPITEPAENLNEVFNLGEVQRNIFSDCWKRGPRSVRKKESVQLLENVECKQSYKSFDDNILQILHYLVQNNIQSISESKSYCRVQVKNLVSRILPLIACDFNIRCPTETNIEFVLEKKYGRNPVYRFSMFLYDIEIENFKSAREYLSVPLTHIHVDALFVIDLCELYMDYMDDMKSAKDKCNTTENLLKALRHYCEEVNPKFSVGWMVLYCVYKKHDYRPGMSYTRWKYENLMDTLFTDIKRIPKSRWKLLNDFQPSLKTRRGKYFWQACEFLLKLGLYYFARWLFDDIINELGEVEIYIVDASLKLAEKHVPPVFALRTPSLVGNEDNVLSKADELNAFVYLVNGNIEYYRDPDALDAMEHYGSLLDIKGVNKDSRFELGVLRYAYRMLEEKQFEEALKAFEFVRSGGHRIVGYVGKAKALYFLDRFEEAEIYFAKTTRFYMHLPDVWAYLAMINLRLGQNYKALECWKYARLDPNVIFDDEILNELGKLDIEILLFVDA